MIYGERSPLIALRTLIPYPLDQGENFDYFTEPEDVTATLIQGRVAVVGAEFRESGTFLDTWVPLDRTFFDSFEDPAMQNALPPQTPELEYYSYNIEN